MTDKDKNILDGIEYAKDIGYVQYLDRKSETDTRLYNCGGVPVELTLPEGDHCAMDDKIHCMNEYCCQLETVWDRGTK